MDYYSRGAAARIDPPPPTYKLAHMTDFLWLVPWFSLYGGRHPWSIFLGSDLDLAGQVCTDKFLNGSSNRQTVHRTLRFQFPMKMFWEPDVQLFRLGSV